MDLRTLAVRFASFTRKRTGAHLMAALGGTREQALDLDFPAWVAREFPQEFPPAWGAVDRLLEAVRGADLSPLERRSPALAGYDWSSYLRCSVIRMARGLSALSARLPAPARLLDFGSYFGNFSLMCAAAGYRVDAVDSYRSYGTAFESCLALLRGAGIGILDFDKVGPDLSGLAPSSYDGVLCMGVVEHVPHTPRPVLEALDRVLRPDGLLLLDTPNLAYVYNRRKLARGESIFCPIALQYATEIPFEGHHREYTLAELRWMLERLGHQEIVIETFNYSLYALGSLRGEDLELFRIMEKDPACREVILSVSRKPPTTS